MAPNFLAVLHPQAIDRIDSLVVSHGIEIIALDAQRRVPSPNIRAPSELWLRTQSARIPARFVNDAVSVGAPPFFPVRLGFAKSSRTEYHNKQRCVDPFFHSEKPPLKGAQRQSKVHLTNRRSAPDERVAEAILHAYYHDPEADIWVRSPKEILNADFMPQRPLSATRTLGNMA